MLKYAFIPGLQYEGESDEEMARREAAMLENNARVDALYEDWKRQRATPMPAMISWAARRGLVPGCEMWDARCGIRKRVA